MGTNFNKVLEDLYGLNHKFGQQLLVVDTHKKLAYRGQLDSLFLNQFNQILGGGHSKVVYSFDTSLRHRIQLASYEKEWNKMKNYGYYEARKSEIVKNVEAYLQREPPNKQEFWKFEQHSFQLWDQNGKLVGKFYEKPRIGFRFERAQIQSKFEQVQQEIINKIGQDKVEVNDLSKSTMVSMMNSIYIQ